jgi:capsular exopolysaccharide synthesis family protein
MEKIKQALDRACKDRSTSPIATKTNKLSFQVGDVEKQVKINYTETKVINVSEVDLREKRVILGKSNDVGVSDQYKVLRTHVLQRLKANNWNSLAVTSPNKGSGKTLTCVNLALSLAKEVNHSVLLVDMDLKHPSIHDYFLPGDHLGISDYLSKNIDIRNILINPSIERIVVLPGNKSIANSSEMLSSPKMVQLVKELIARYPKRLVIFDLPPILACDDVIVFVPYIEAVMLVVEEGGTTKEELKRAIELLKNTKLIGTVLNKSKSKSGSRIYY